MDEHAERRALPSVERVLTSADAAPLIARFGRPAVTATVRAILDELRAELAAGGAPPSIDDAIAARLAQRLEDEFRPPLRPVFNLTGTVLHTNFGRAALPQEAIDGDGASGRREQSRIRSRQRRARRPRRPCRAAPQDDSPAPRPRPSSTTMRRRCCSSSTASRSARRCRPRAASSSRSAARSACPTSWRARAAGCARSAPRTARTSPITRRRSAPRPGSS